MRRTQTERREATTTALLGAARELFAERGVAATSRDDIAERAGVTRGALYHHFPSKNAVAAAVIGALDEELSARVIAAAARSSDPFGRLRRAARAYIDACAEPDVARLLLEAPLVLTADELRAMNEATCLRLLEPALSAGLDLPGDLAVTARLLLGMLDEAARLVATDPQAKRRVNATVDAVLGRVLAR
jgi:AcrR family transcriptional regulator